MCTGKAKKENVGKKSHQKQFIKTPDSRSLDGTTSDEHTKGTPTGGPTAQDNTSKIPQMKTAEVSNQHPIQLDPEADKTKPKPEKNGKKTDTKAAKTPGKARSPSGKQRLQSTRVSEIEDQLPSGTSNYSLVDSKMKQGTMAEDTGCGILADQRTEDAKNTENAANGRFEGTGRRSDAVFREMKWCFRNKFIACCVVGRKLVRSCCRCGNQKKNCKHMKKI